MQLNLHCAICSSNVVVRETFSSSSEITLLSSEELSTVEPKSSTIESFLSLYFSMDSKTSGNVREESDNEPRVFSKNSTNVLLFSGIAGLISGNFEPSFISNSVCAFIRLSYPCDTYDFDAVFFECSFRTFMMPSCSIGIMSSSFLKVSLGA
uniref:Uncharacterized protein n=1 Tax=Cacopsylla melanoneura TaxID=428564 RepID=A0A8D8R1R6_9HEMI